MRTALSKKNDPDGLLFLMEISRNSYMPKISIHHTYISRSVGCANSATPPSGMDFCPEIVVKASKSL